MKIFLYSVMCIVACLISGCTGSIDFSSYNPQKDYGFTAQTDDVGISNPPTNKARIYAFREKRFVGAGVRYNMTIHTLTQAKGGYEQGYFFGYSRPGLAMQMDIVPNGEAIFISGKTEARVSFSFTPQAGKIYCIASGYGAGFFIARPAFTLVDKQVCQKYISQYLNPDSMQQWLKDKARFEEK